MSEPLFLSFEEVQTLHVLYRVMIDIAEKRCSKEELARVFREAFPQAT